MTDLSAQDKPVAGEGGADRSPLPRPGVPRSPLRRAGRTGLLTVMVLAVLAALSLLAVLALTGKPIRLPVWTVAEIETRANAALQDALPGASVSVGGIEIMLDPDWTPRLRLEDLRLLQAPGTTVFALPDLRLSFDARSFLTERALRPASVRLIGGAVVLNRRADGRLDLRIGAEAAPPISSLNDLFAQIDRALESPLLSELDRIEAQGASLTLIDARLNRTWTVGDGRITLDNRADALAAEVGLTLASDSGAPAQALVTLIRPKGQAVLRVSAMVEGVAAADIAAQTPLLGVLGVLDAPISGQIAAELSAEGLTALDAQIALGAGALHPDPATKPIGFDGAALTLGYDPARGRVVISDLSVEGPTLRLKASGHSYLLGEAGDILTGPLGQRLPAGFLGQVQISDAQIDPEGLFERPLRFSAGAMDARLTLNPFRLEIGQISLIEEAGRRLTLAGGVTALAAGWQVALDLTLDAIAHDRLLQIWPKSAVPRTRDWVGQNVAQGLLTDVKAALRISPGTEPQLALGYEFDGAEVRFLRTLPPIRNGRGRSSIEGTAYTVVLDGGTVDAPLGGQINAAGSVFSVPDVTAKPARADIRLRTESSLTAALSLLDLPPFGFMTKAGRGPDLGQGRAVMDTRLSLPLVRRVLLPDVDYAVTGQILGLSSDVLVPGRTITAEGLILTADPTGLRIEGPGRIGQVPFDVAYTQGFGPDQRGKSRVEGTASLSPATVAEFGLGLPQGMVSGAGTADVAIDLTRDAPARLRLTSDLAGIGLTLPAVGWTKSPGNSGRLEVEATLGPVPQISRLAVEGGGLEATGAITLADGGGLQEARFDQVRLNGWLTGGVTLTGRGQGRAPDVAVTGGTVDLRRLSIPQGGQGAGGQAQTQGALSLSLDRLIVSDGIALTGFRADLSQRGGLNGPFRASINEAAAVNGVVVPSRHGTAVRLQSADAGAALRAAGIFRSAGGGTLDLRLTPRAQKGVYDGRAEISQVRVRDANVLAELLSAISVVGLLEQLGGEGILFSTAEADFVIVPGAIEITQASAMGASLGVSIAGLFGTQSKRLALQGVVSPIYLVNGIGAVLTRPGEGVFGFNYALTGTAEAPQVSVNPLSILTPGMFREIFRSPAPQLPRRN
ncbi:AsmA-like C-terminal region-containing protein [Pseudotabrizicola formosa]|uniref:AsmA-like C-terminal region-containing protein n=1 Tax=Pseudotabrizicola formosa TaxID=2030009 RepID=UPI001FEF63FC|nr:AsmA-like C-terminal region-containing protein [Pseudotabrizicola formosa]